MIREYKTEEIDSLVSIWLEASLIAHDFIDAQYWKSAAEDMRNQYIPMSKTYVYIDDASKHVMGFVSLLDNHIAALFVSSSHQRKGIGKRLIEYIKNSYSVLSVNVYAENEGSVEFYLQQAFVVQEEKIDEHTGHKELVMAYLHS